MGRQKRLYGHVFVPREPVCTFNLRVVLKRFGQCHRRLSSQPDRDHLSTPRTTGVTELGAAEVLSHSFDRIFG
jgi:hypothetical protein